MKDERRRLRRQHAEPEAACGAGGTQRTPEEQPGIPVARRDGAEAGVVEGVVMVAVAGVVVALGVAESCTKRT